MNEQTTPYFNFHKLDVVAATKKYVVLKGRFCEAGYRWGVDNPPCLIYMTRTLFKKALDLWLTVKALECNVGGVFRLCGVGGDLLADEFYEHPGNPM